MHSITYSNVLSREKHNFPKYFSVGKYVSLLPCTYGHRERFLSYIENADIDPDWQDKLEAEFAKEIHLLTAEPRLRSIAKAFVRHYSDLWTSGKAMFVCLTIDKDKLIVRILETIERGKQYFKKTGFQHTEYH